MRKTDDGIRATVTSVTAMIPAERGSLSIAASSPKKSPALISQQQDLAAGSRLELNADRSAHNEKHVVGGVLIIDNPLVTG